MLLFKYSNSMRKQVFHSKNLPDRIPLQNWSSFFFVQSGLVGYNLDLHPVLSTTCIMYCNLNLSLLTVFSTASRWLEDNESSATQTHVMRIALSACWTQ